MKAEETQGKDMDQQFAWSSAELAKLDGWVWPQYRGLRGDGHAAAEAKPPVEWSETKNLLWKAELPGRAWSSPVVWGDKVWVTDADEDGKEQRLFAWIEKREKCFQATCYFEMTRCSLTTISPIPMRLLRL